MLLAQKKSKSNSNIINEAIRLFFNLADLDYKPDYINYTYFQYLSNSKDDIVLLNTYYSNKIFDTYIVQVTRKGFRIVNHLSEVYGLPDIYKCINGNLLLYLILNIDVRQKFNSMNLELSFLDRNKISHKDLLYRILIVYINIINSNLNQFIILDAFALASLSNSDKYN